MGRLREALPDLISRADRVGQIALLSAALAALAGAIHGVFGGSIAGRGEQTRPAFESPAGRDEGGDDVDGRARYGVEVFPVPGGHGYGYQISMDGGTVIHQPHLPGPSGRVPFASEADARRVAELMVTRMRAGVFPPAVSAEDLDSLGVWRPEAR